MENVFSNVENPQLLRCQIQIKKYKYLDTLKKYQAEFDELAVLENSDVTEEQEDRLHVKIAEVTEKIKWIDKLLAKYPEVPADEFGARSTLSLKQGLTIAGSGIQLLDQMLTDFANDQSIGSNVAQRCICQEDVYEMLEKIRLSGAVPNMDVFFLRNKGIDEFVEHVCVIYTRQKRLFFSRDYATEHLRREHASADKSPAEPPFALSPVIENEPTSFEEGIRLMFAAAAQEQKIDAYDRNELEEGELVSSTDGDTCISNELDENTYTPKKVAETMEDLTDDVEIISEKLTKKYHDLFLRASEKPKTVNSDTRSDCIVECTKLLVKTKKCGFDFTHDIIDLTEGESAMETDAACYERDANSESSIEVVARDANKDKVNELFELEHSAINKNDTMVDPDSSFELCLSSSDEVTDNDDLESKIFNASSLKKLIVKKNSRRE